MSNELSLALGLALIFPHNEHYSRRTGVWMVAFCNVPGMACVHALSDRGVRHASSSQQIVDVAKQPGDISFKVVRRGVGVLS